MLQKKGMARLLVTTTILLLITVSLLHWLSIQNGFCANHGLCSWLWFWGCLKRTDCVVLESRFGLQDPLRSWLGHRTLKSTELHAECGS
jgi:hypothetical protein